MLIAGFVLFVVGIVFIVSYPYNKRRNARCTVQTQGVLSDIQKRFNSKGSLKPAHIYTYTVDGVEYQLRTLDHSLQVSRVGDSCDIWYNPQKPEDAQAFRGSDKYLKTLLMVGIAALLLGIVLTCVGFVQQYVV